MKSEGRSCDKKSICYILNVGTGKIKERGEGEDERKLDKRRSNKEIEINKNRKQEKTKLAGGSRDV